MGNLTEGTRELLLEHAVRVDEDGVLVYRVYAVCSYETKEEFVHAARQRTRQTSLFPQMGAGSGGGSRNEVRQPSEGSRGTLNPAEAPETQEEDTSLTDEEVEEWLNDDDDSEFSGSQDSETSKESSPSRSNTSRLTSKSASHTESKSRSSPSTGQSTRTSPTSRRPRWPTSSARRTRSKGSWGKSS